MRSRAVWSVGFVVAAAMIWEFWALGESSRPSAASGQPAGEGMAAATDAEKLAYGAGYMLGEEVRTGLEADGVKVDFALVEKGFIDGLEQREPALDRDELEEVLAAVHREMQARTVRRLLEEDPSFRALHDANLARSQAFLAENAAKAGWVVLDSGAQYKVVRAGDGPSPTFASTVRLHYQAYKIDGSPLDGGRDKVLRVAKVLPGGREVLPRMKVGEKWEVVLPPELAFGAAGDPPSIGPNEAIRFDVELLEIVQ